MTFIPKEMKTREGLCVSNKVCFTGRKKFYGFSVEGEFPTYLLRREIY